MTRPPSGYGPNAPGAWPPEPDPRRRQQPAGQPPQGNPPQPGGHPGRPQQPGGYPPPPPGGYPSRPGGYPVQPSGPAAPPGGFPLQPRTGYPQRSGYPQQQGFPPPPGYGAAPTFAQPRQPAYRPPMPPPAAYTQPGMPAQQRPAPPRRRRWGTLVVILILLVSTVVLRTAIRTGLSALGSGDKVQTTYSNDPGSENAGVAKTSDNPLVTDDSLTLIPERCNYSPWGTDVEVARKFFETAASCLADAWKPLFDDIKLPFEPPKLNVSATTSGITTLCTGNSSNFAAFYCSADKTIYMPVSQLQTDIYKNNWVVYLSVFAHEYGHHVQAESGILGKVHQQRRDAGARSDTGLELSRRTELQANCFDGMFLSSSNNGGSLSNAQIGVARNDMYHRGDAPGDMRDHGTSQNGGGWFELGYDRNRTAQCNTFAAAVSKVN
ncbi:neutral zinc metallopeptidase [Nocardia sp. SYP-A9097]|uniref:neutral zinc metallopeptidase n=1 Tax=Nocardia sp. SYP-A9097 TaxID=2663237 RepID=UPI001E4572B5|nr:neutral zinc metallopeptidase [Nocardia sp. SYP-A9097]